MLWVDSLLPEWNKPPWQTVATLRFDRSNFDFSTSTADGHDLRFETMDSVAIPFAVEVWDSAAGNGRVLVKMAGDYYRPWAWIRMLWGDRTLSSVSDPVSVWAGIPDSTVLLVNSVLVDDFEDSNTTSLLPSRATWHTGTSVSGAPITLGFAAAGAGRAGEALHVTYSAPASGQYDVVQVTLAGGAPRSFRSLDSVVFWARGSGQVRFALEHLVNGVGTKAWKTVNLATVWSRFRIGPADFDAPSGGLDMNTGWTAVRDSITSMTFVVQGGTEVYLDDIRVHGLDRDDLK
jgi:hypothetical protein